MSIYQPFLDYAIGFLKEQLEIVDYQIPLGFEEKKTVTGKGKKAQEVVTTSYGFASSKLRQIRAAHVEVLSQKFKNDKQTP